MAQIICTPYYSSSTKPPNAQIRVRTTKIGANLDPYHYRIKGNKKSNTRAIDRTLTGSPGQPEPHPIRPDLREGDETQPSERAPKGSGGLTGRCRRRG